MTPLFKACDCGSSEVVLNLIQHGASLDITDKGGRNCLHYAASGGHDFILKTLLDRGVSANSLDENKLRDYSISTRLNVMMHLFSS